MEIIDIQDQLQNQDKSVNKLLSLSGGEVMNLQLKQGQEIPSHKVLSDVVIVILKGKVIFTVDGKDVVATPEKLLHFSPEENHALKAQEDSSILVLRIKG